MVQGWMNELMGKEEQVKDKRMTVKSVVPAHFEAGNTEKYKFILRWGIFSIPERTTGELSILMEAKGLLAVKPNQEECVWC